MVQPYNSSHSHMPATFFFLMSILFCLLNMLSNKKFQASDVLLPQINFVQTQVLTHIVQAVAFIVISNTKQKD